mmetsp:Transcript_27589/g.61104  ORF Transcript_27589/g.61104 Transcript_27589/m.61104 type:complete len:103 (-) Transcript_27589:93-401(-)|eukprot:CAMPEP_0173191648 /NCGR_PEP_ID=MMETSP1141-20130122/13000_1 /TAXON_ID=483371 /ORGANISM="non described non described, Strain CCMP2298" /LENGTH=102 /DNA_ID=CAMNT_0014115857 /DNA_START=127 /DNA_END=435 /DNA_ORIENTATION=-
MPQFLHIVLVQFKAETPLQTIDDIFSSLSALLERNLIPGLLEYNGGAYDSPEGFNKGFTHAFTMKFADRESRDAYFPHPEHDKVKDALLENVDNAVAFDFAL